VEIIYRSTYDEFIQPAGGASATSLDRYSDLTPAEEPRRSDILMYANYLSRCCRPFRRLVIAHNSDIVTRKRYHEKGMTFDRLEWAATAELSPDRQTGQCRKNWKWADPYV
jgi:hypothetical protein